MFLASEFLILRLTTPIKLQLLWGAMLPLFCKSVIITEMVKY